MNSKILLFFALSFLGSTITVNAMSKHQKKIEKHRHKAEKKARARASAKHDVNCNGKCWQCAPNELIQQSSYDKR